MKRLRSENDLSSKQVDEETKNNLRGPCAEISLLYNLVPRLRDSFEIKKKVGEGTFSSVYLARIKGSGPKYKCVALKHLIPTIQPNKILLELQCLQKFGGRCNVMGLLSCVREGSHTVIVMPFFPNNRFVDFYSQMDIDEVRDYMKNLLEALAFVHSVGVIHRDVKPSNFLYNRKLRKYALVDFGLAQKATSFPSSRPKHRLSQPVNPVPSAFVTTEEPQDKAFVKLSPSTLSGMNRRNSRLQLFINGTDNNTNDYSQNCRCQGNAQVCRLCLTKPTQAAFRAGTPGYRPPEVLLKHPNQTTAVDVWAAGVILLSILSGRFPFFYGTDDITSLVEITTLFGTESIKQCAAKLDKVITCSPSVPAVNLQQTCEALRHTSSFLNTDDKTETNKVFDLLRRLLDVNLETRITASNALHHDFFKTPSVSTPFLFAK